MNEAENLERATGPRGRRRVFVATDLGACMDRAADRALMLAAKGGAIRFVHVVDPSSPRDEVTIGRLHEAMTRLTSDIRDNVAPGRIDVTGEVLLGAIAETIVRAAAIMRADVIVTGSPRDMSLLGMIRGTVVDNVIRRAPCPVLVVKSRVRRPYVKIAAAIDLEGSSRNALTFAIEEFPGAAVEVIHVDEGVREADNAGAIRDRIEALTAACVADSGHGAANESGDISIRLAQGQPASVLLEELRRMSPDLVVLGTHGRTGVDSLMFGSVAETLTALLFQDTLIVRA